MDSDKYTGNATTKAFARLGAQVAVVDINEAEAKSTFSTKTC
jgi:hypothetical protein